jgi:hypothetical protein
MSAALETPTKPAKVPRYERCVPSGGKYPGEDHEALLSWIEHGTVVISVRHLATGECSTVPLSEVRTK